MRGRRCVIAAAHGLAAQMHTWQHGFVHAEISAVAGVAARVCAAGKQTHMGAGNEEGSVAASDKAAEEYGCRQ